MANATKPKDIVISYAVVSATCGYFDTNVEEALKDGYRIVDIISTGGGNGGSGMGGFVTILLTLPVAGMDYWSYYKGTVK